MPARVGDRCVVLAPLRPTGLVQVDGERLEARALVGAIDPGTEAVVVGWDPFGLVVRPAAEVSNPGALANHGEPCPGPKELTAERDAEAEQLRRESFWAEYGQMIGERLTVLLPITVVGSAAGWWWFGVPGIAVGAAVAILISMLILAWLVLN